MKPEKSRNPFSANSAIMARLHLYRGLIRNGVGTLASYIYAYYDEDGTGIFRTREGALGPIKPGSQDIRLPEWVKSAAQDQQIPANCRKCGERFVTCSRYNRIAGSELISEGLAVNSDGRWHDQSSSSSLEVLA